MDKEQEIRNMLEHIAGKEYTIRKRAEGVFYLERDYGIDTSSLPSDRYRNFTVDFNNKTIEAYSYEESYHNGDHYNCSNDNVAWECLLSAHDALMRVLRKELEKEVIDELRNALTNKKLAEILKGNS
jgi:hypothetical protein